MKNKIEELIRLSNLELSSITDKIANSNEINEELENEAIYWSIRLQTLMQVMDLIKEETRGNNIIH